MTTTKRLVVDLGAEAMRPVRGGVALPRTISRAEGERSKSSGRASPSGDAGVPSDLLPPLYSSWIADLLPGAIPDEGKATCNDCTMAPIEPGPLGDELFFEPSTKCCTFLPNLPNFLAGRALKDEDPAASFGRDTVVRRIRARAAVSPLGLDATSAYALRYRHTKGAFGRAKVLRCPHYLEDGGLCGVWRHRNSTCATWFCKHERGDTGAQFWIAVRDLLASAEAALSYWCAGQLDLRGDELDALHSQGVNTMHAQSDAFRGRSSDLTGSFGVPSPGRYERLWGSWAGREEAYYLACEALVAPLAWADLLRLFPKEMSAQAAIVSGRHGALLSRDVPATLVDGEYDLVQIGAQSVRVHSYRDYDPQSLPKALGDALPSFDGRPVDEVVAELEAGGLRIDAALLGKLVDFGILR